MSGKVGGSGSASAQVVFDRTVAEAVRQSKLLAQHDDTFVPPSDDASSVIAMQMFARVADTTGASGGRTLTFDTHLQAGDPSYDGSADATLTSDATDVNTASTIVARDASGNFAAGTITADELVSNGNVTASGGTVDGLHVTAGDVAATGNVSTSGGTVSGLHGSFGDVDTTGNIASSGGTVSGLHGVFGDVSTTGNLHSSSGTVSGVHLVVGDIEVTASPTAATVTQTHWADINLNGTHYKMLLGT